MAQVTLTHEEVVRGPRDIRDIVGDAVYTSDGEQFAYVKEVRGGYFHLDVPWANDYWLSTYYIDETRDDKVCLKLRRDELDDHRLRAPGIEEDIAPDRAVTADHLVDDLQALQQREKMEHDLFDHTAKDPERNGY